MKTEVVMKRELFGVEVSQKSKSEMLSGTDLVRAGNKWRRANDMSDFNLSQWLKRQSTLEFISELKAKYGKVLVMGRGRSAHTWLHPLLFIDCALAISPKLKIEAYEWLFDNLIRFRNESGDSYKSMCGSLYVRASSKVSFHNYVIDVAKKIKLACGVVDWQNATEKQLEKRKKLHNDIALLSDVLNNNDEAVRLAIVKAAGY